ncbi:MAG TPA: hypothetical protein VK066_08745 [Chloroflexota bacterium]|nr:hypothetical protein [Chloroflexota bacterium]
MQRFAVAILVIGLAGLASPRIAAAQCEGGPTVTGMYTPDGAYVGAHCLYTNPTTPGQLYPSGAEPVPSTNPANGASRLPGQAQPADQIPVNSSDLGPAPSLVNDPARRAVPQQVTTVPVPGVNLVPAPAATNGAQQAIGVPGPVNPVTTEPAELPTSGAPALTGNRADPTADHFPGQLVNPEGPTVAPASVAPLPATTTGTRPPAVIPPVSEGSGPPTRIRVPIAGPDDGAVGTNDGATSPADTAP